MKFKGDLQKFYQQLQRYQTLRTGSPIHAAKVYRGQWLEAEAGVPG